MPFDAVEEALLDRYVKLRSYTLREHAEQLRKKQDLLVPVPENLLVSTLQNPSISGSRILISGSHMQENHISDARMQQENMLVPREDEISVPHMREKLISEEHIPEEHISELPEEHISELPGKHISEEHIPEESDILVLQESDLPASNESFSTNESLSTIEPTIPDTSILPILCTSNLRTTILCTSNLRTTTLCTSILRTPTPCTSILYMFQPRTLFQLQVLIQLRHLRQRRKDGIG
ncbi:hypothetical protein NHQ30_001276 [Ciborinia camelliae]|nr:hypothetical protein NHQ30_001276 [Ciborinia camelliae]